MLSDIRAIHSRVESMRRNPAAQNRDQSIENVRKVRRGNIDQLFPDHFADDLPKSVVANLVDTAARDIAEMMAPLPALACVSGNMNTFADEQRASKKNKIGSAYWIQSKLAQNMIRFADSMNSYSFAVFVVEPNYALQTPIIRVESPFGCYYHKDRWGDLQYLCKVKRVRVGVLAAEYPEYAALILRDDRTGGTRSDSHELEMIRYMDCRETVIYLPECRNLVLVRAKNPCSRLTAVVAERPDLEDTPRGQYDDVIWVQLARAIMAMYALKAADQSVNAPWALPDDVTQVTLGADAVLRSQNPQQIGRVKLDIPRDAFALLSSLDTESKTGARYPQARTGGVQGSIITGRGVQELLGTMDTQIQAAQTVFKQALEDATSIAFELDCRLWENTQKKITGVLTGKPFELTYVPVKDIGTNYKVQVTYGFAAGQSPAQAVVMLLQLRGDQLISRDTMRRQLPFDLDPEEEQRAVEVEQMETSLLMGFDAFLQSMGPLVQQGQDPTMLLQTAAKAVDARQKGKPLHEAILGAMQEQQKQQQEEQQEQSQPGQPGQPGETPPGMQDNGLPQGVAAGQAGKPPGGMPAVEHLLAEFRGSANNPRMSAGVDHKIALGTG